MTELPVPPAHVSVGGRAAFSKPYPFWSLLISALV